MKPALRIYLVDDEAPAVQRLERLLTEIGGCEVIGTTTRPEAAEADCARLLPHLVLLDVEMPGMDGVALGRKLAGLAKPPALVFVTAYEGYAVDAFDLAAVDYLVKPVRRQRLEQALARVRAAAPRVEREPALTARLGERVLAIPIHTIRVLLADDKYTSVHYIGGVALVDDSLVSLEERYPDRFLRVHRNALVARRHLRALARDSGGRDHVEVDGVDCRPEVSRRNLPAVRRELHS
ncbi:MAG: LytR/AlgR family response regulator transcription factor [Wenzhouxiangella sp.]